MLSERVKRRVLWLLAEADSAAQTDRWPDAQGFLREALNVSGEGSDALAPCVHCKRPAVEQLRVCTECGAEQTTASDPKDLSSTRNGNVEQQAIKKANPSAWEPWTPDADALLTKRFRAGTTTRELVREFGRTEGAIQSRLRRLELT